MAEVYRIEIHVEVQDKTDPGVSRATAKMNGFDKANQKTQERLDRMNRTKYQVVLDALDKASGIVGRVSTNVRSFAGKTFTFTMKMLDIATAPLPRDMEHGDVHSRGDFGSDRGVCRHIQADGNRRRL